MADPTPDSPEAPAAEEAVRVVQTLALLAQPLVWAGIGGRYPWALLGLEESAKVAWGVLAVAILAAGVPLSRAAKATTARRARLHRLNVVLILVCPPLTIGFDLFASRHFATFGYRFPTSLIALEGFLFVALVIWFLSPRSPGSGIVIATIAATAHRLAAVPLFPLDERRSDMFQVTVHAARTWLSGGSPYVDVLDQGLKYLPGTWMAQAPSVLLGLDPRIPGSLLLLFVGLWFARELRSTAGVAAPEQASAAELLAMLVFLNPYHAFRHDLYFDVFIALTAGIFLIGAKASGTRRSLPGLSILAGLAVATRQWAWVYGPFALLAAGAGAAARSRRRASSPAPAGAPGWSSLVGRLLGAATLCFLTVLVVVAPLVALSPSAFQRGCFAFNREIGGEVCLGVSTLAVRLGVASLLPVLQAVICVVAFAALLRAALRGRAGPSAILATGWLVWCAVVVLNPFVENYFYISPGFAAAALAIVGARTHLTRNPTER